MYLSCLLIDVGDDPDRPRPGRTWLRNIYHVHQRLCMAFPSRERMEADPPFPTAERYVEYWLRRRAQRLALRERQSCQARANLPRIVDVLVREHGVRRVILYGSLARDRFGENSDIDLAVEGLKKEDYFPALAAVNRLTRWWVDLKPLEDLDAHFRERVLATGECIYA